MNTNIIVFTVAISQFYKLFFETFNLFTLSRKPKVFPQVILESYYQLADSDRCVAESKGGLLHELFHVFGVGVVTIRIRRFLKIMIMINPALDYSLLSTLRPCFQHQQLMISCQQIISISITDWKK